MKIYVRERMMSKEGSRNPRYRVVATEGGDLRVHADHLRKVDLDTIADDLGAQVVYLPERGEGESKKKEHEPEHKAESKPRRKK
jgi:hypothetical protein